MRGAEVLGSRKEPFLVSGFQLMTRTTFKTLTWLMWLALPLTALRYWLAWDQLPLRMATHFNAAGKANGWMTREVALEFGVGITAFLLIIFTLILHAVKRTDAFSWGLLGFFYLLMASLYAVNSGIVEYNLTGRPVNVNSLLLLVPIAVLALTAIFLGTRRGKALPEEPLIAQEVHGSRLWTVVFVVPLVLEAGLFLAAPADGVGVAAGLLAVLFLFFAALTWSGFEYRFTRSGVEIRTLGFRLRSISAEEIQTYEIAKWGVLGGYGIRGVGNCRAYVWGNRGVRIKTRDGQVFLGHGEPERIVRDLDAMRQLAG